MTISPTHTSSINQYYVLTTTIIRIQGLKNGPSNNIYYTYNGGTGVYQLEKNNPYIDLSTSFSYDSYNLADFVFDKNNNLYITDYLNNVIYEVDYNLNASILTNLTVNKPTGICVSDDNNVLYIVDSLNNRIISYDINASSQNVLYNGNLNRVYYIAINNGYLYFFNKDSNNYYQLIQFNTNNNTYSSLYNMNDINFNAPHGITFDADNILYVANTVLNTSYSLIGKFVPTYTSGVITGLTFYEAYTTQISSDNNVNEFITNPYVLLYFNSYLYCGNSGSLNNNNHLISIYNQLPYTVNGKITNPGAYAVNSGYGAFPIYCSIANYTNSYYSMNDMINSHYVLPGYKLITFQDAYYPTPVQTIDNTQNIYVLSGDQNVDQISSCRFYYKNGEIIQTGISCDSLPYP